MTGIAMPAPDAGLIANRDSLAAALARLLPPGTVVSDSPGRRAFETDAFPAYRCPPLAVVLPRSTEEVSAAVRFCRTHGIGIVARGTGTSLCGGALPLADSIVISLTRMNRVLDVNIANRTARVEAGITNLGISNAVAPLKFYFAPDPSSQAACTIGGNIATNAGGAHCLKYGVTAAHVLGVKMVLASGDVVELGGEHLDAAGYDLLGLTIGGEGMFGIVTEATVRILRQPEGARPVLLGFDSSQAAGACVAAIIAAGIVPAAIEFMDKPAIALCEDFAKAGYPRDVEALLIVEVEGSEDETGELLDEIAGIAAGFGPKVIRVSQSEAESAAIWKGRKAASAAIGRLADYYCVDGVIPLSRLPDTLRDVSRICASYGLKVANLFHAGDGNLHPHVMFDAAKKGERDKAEACCADILKLCVEKGGCLTGEHGVGIEKRDLMPVQFSPEDLRQQMRVKAMFDPQWLLNPGKVFPLDQVASFRRALIADG